MHPSLSACLITLNEAPVIARALASLRGAVDEIVVVDGGSTDATVGLARAAGARVVLEPWRHDFAHARNVAVAAATGDWVLFLDSDETLEPGGGELLRIAARSGQHPAWLVHIRHATAGGDSTNERVRFGRRDPTRRFERRIHERVIPAFTSVGRTTATIRHWPNPPAQRHVKHRRNLHLLDLHLAEQPDDLYCRVERLHTLRALQDTAWSADLAATAARVDWCSQQSEREGAGNLAVLIELALLAPAADLPTDLTHADFAVIAAACFPRHCLLAGLACWRWAESGAWHEAIKAGERALRLWRTRTFDPSHPFDPSFLQDQLPATLAHAHRQLGQAQAAGSDQTKRVRLLSRAVRTSLVPSFPFPSP